MLILGGCMDHLEDTGLSSSDHIAFKGSLADNGNSLKTKGFTGILDFEEEEWELHTDLEVSTKTTLQYSLNGLEAGVYAYVYNGEWNDTREVYGDINNGRYTFDGDQLNADRPVKWSTVETDTGDGYRFRAFVYAPYEAVGLAFENNGKGAPTINISDVASRQTDIVTADNEVTMNFTTKEHRKEIQLDFEHIYTAIQFKAGFDCTITAIELANIVTGGEYKIGSGWELAAETKSYNLSLPAAGLDVSNGDDIGDLILMIPQKIQTDDAAITLSYIEKGTSHTISTTLKGVEWKQGKKITYTLMKESDRQYIYMDLAAGDIAITDNRYSGYVFVNGEPKPVTGTIKDGQKYYIYQSCTANKGNKNYKKGFTAYNETDQSAGGTFTKPVYDLATGPDGRLWSDFITDNDDVEAVIEAWDDQPGATDNTSTDRNRAVWRAGRESTKNTITIKGSLGECEMIIDNIYSSYQKEGGHNRTTGSMFIVPEWGTSSKLVLNLIGDNRLGCLHYDNRGDELYGSDEERQSNTNFLIIQGEGSLTVADTDFHKRTDVEEGYYSNHYDSAIGNSDGRNSTYGIIINSGTIFAGTTLAENSSAIGAGGNGYGDVVINGGVVTAVASTTGTAIGGGIGFADTGGKGHVEIHGGNVYAYNKDNGRQIPSSAIGGAGSNAKAGSEGIVIITGGTIYAQSDLGTAIGGGSSATKEGGYGHVTITGGNVIAKSLSPISAGIGGGSTCTKGGELTEPNGGNAIIVIGVENDPGKNPIVRTGSIGGGGTGAAGGTVGNAQISVYGGDIQAQFVMAQSEGNIFNMSGGLIRNSSTSDNDYYCIKPDGGAVYMEQGTFTMSGGTIKQCSADKEATSKGGAVYIKGNENTSFIMRGGEIRECKANTDGGAVYLDGGKVTIEGGLIEGNVAYNGNGGAISILGGSFTMNGDDACINNNTAFGSGVTGNGGGIYVAPASSSSTSAIEIKLNKGNITANSADRNGGGVCVDMGNNSTAQLSVTVGAAESPSINIEKNGALIKGGGMYINGTRATVNLNDGKILNNETSSYQVNPNIVVDGGLVTLMKPGITTQVTITYNDNAQYYTQGEMEDQTSEQYVVSASKSKFTANGFSQINDYYNTFTGWNTRRDGRGTQYGDEALVSLNEDLVLYAQWE